MKESEKKAIASIMGKGLLRPWAILQITFFIMLLASPFIWIWSGWSFAWRIGLTGLLGAIIFGKVYDMFKRGIENGVGEAIDKMENGDKVSKKFKDKLDRAKNKLSDGND